MTEKYDPFQFESPESVVANMAAQRANPETPITGTPVAIEGVPESAAFAAQQRMAQTADEYHRANLPNDPWAHRSAKMRCGTCMWWVEKQGVHGGLGRCRRHSPTLGGFPAVYNWDWCGDHKLDENKA